MTKLKLKDWIIPTLGVFVVCGAIIVYYLIGNIINYNFNPEQDLVTSPIIDATQEVQKEVTKKPIKPFNNDQVSISKNYYSYEDEEKVQEQSLIQYENIFMPNTGILYSSDSEFDCIATLDGKIVSIKDDDILGTIIEIEHSNNIVSIYESVKDVKVKIGDTIKQGDVIAKSGPNKLTNEKENCLHFETYKDGSLINPEDFYNLDLS
ncbi:MAG TPA: hypothetical protein DCE23_01060 [Firmicutes bacterium]|nr:hypothetical protein [Bacillota bacterium]